MTNADRPKIAEILALLGETFNEPISELRAEGYFLALQEFDAVEVKDAALAAIRESKFFPRPAELREKIIGCSNSCALAAWSNIRRQIRQVGHTGKPELSDLELHAVRDVWGSWKRLCEVLPESGPGYSAWEKRFQEAYAAAWREDSRKHLNAVNQKALNA